MPNPVVYTYAYYHLCIHTFTYYTTISFRIVQILNLKSSLPRLRAECGGSVRRMLRGLRRGPRGRPVTGPRAGPRPGVTKVPLAAGRLGFWGFSGRAETSKKCFLTLFPKQRIVERLAVGFELLGFHTLGGLLHCSRRSHCVGTMSRLQGQGLSVSETF